MMKPLLLSLFLILCSCNHYEANPSRDYQPNYPTGLFQVPENSELTEQKILKIESQYQVIEHQIKKPYYRLDYGQKKHQLSFEVYRPKDNKKRPLILVLPISGGDYFFSRYFAKAFVKKGFVVSFIHRQEKYKRFNKLSQLAPTLEQMILDHRQILDYLCQQDYIDTQQIACFGISLGAIKGSMLTGIEKRIKTSVFVLGGGDMPHLLTNSNQKNVKRRRAELMESHKLDIAGFQNYLKETLKVDPLTYAHNISPERCLMFLGRFDKAVPYEDGLKLYQAIDRPRLIKLFAGHYTAIAFLPYIRWKSSQFFLEKLQQAKDEE